MTSFPYYVVRNAKLVIKSDLTKYIDIKISGLIQILNQPANILRGLTSELWFKREGGIWPIHCVADSVGAAIWPAIMNELLEVSDKVTVLHKGEDARKEEYSIFKNPTASEKIQHIIDTYNIDQIDICGLAGDVCVSDTIHDAIALNTCPQINVLTAFSPSIDGGKTLKSIISKYGLLCDR